MVQKNYIYNLDDLKNRIHKHKRSMTPGCKGIRIRKSEFVAQTQFLWKNKLSSELNIGIKELIEIFHSV